MLPMPSSLSQIPQQPISFLQELLALASSPLLCYCLAQTDKKCLLNYSVLSSRLIASLLFLKSASSEHQFPLFNYPLHTLASPSPGP